MTSFSLSKPILGGGTNEKAVNVKINIDRFLSSNDIELSCGD